MACLAAISCLPPDTANSSSISGNVFEDLLDEPTAACLGNVSSEPVSLNAGRSVAQNEV